MLFEAQAANVFAQEIHLDLPKQAGDSHAQRVTVDDTSQTIVAGKPAWIELVFHVAPGFHINSHLPHDELLIATSLDIRESPSYHVQQEIYPSGEPLRLNLGAGETLSTYAGDFRIRVEVIATKGESALVAFLRYQACNTASCFPARNLPVHVSLVAR